MDNDLLGIVLEQARRFGRGLDAAKIDEDADIPRELLKAAAEIGLFGLAIPESHEGLGLTLGETSQVVAELARWDRSVATTIGLHAGLGTRGLIGLGNETLKDRWLPRLASGDVIAAFAATEPGAGSDLTRISTVAEVVGEELCLTGEKAYVTNGAFAGLFTVLARTPGLGGARGMSLLLVPADAPGVVIGAEEHKLGIRGSSTVTVNFDGVRLPMDHVLGEPGKGLTHAHFVLEWGRSLMSAGCLGTARAAFDAALAHTQVREQFGRRLADIGGVQAQLAAMTGRLWAMEAAVEQVGAAFDGDGDLNLPSSVAKVFCSEGAFDVCDRSLQLHGALGFIEETGVALMLRDTRVTRIFEGANDVLRLHMGTALIAAKDVAVTVHGDVPGVLVEEGAAFDAVASRLADELEKIRKRLGIRAIRHPRLLAHLGGAFVALRVASASIERARGGSAVGQKSAARAVRLLLTEAELDLRALDTVERQTELDRDLIEALDGYEKSAVHKKPRLHREVRP